MTELHTEEEIDRALERELSAWTLDGVSVRRSVEAPSFIDGIRLVQQVAEVAEPRCRA